MGLAASQARLLLLTAKNNALELQAQMVEQERLILAQEQETIAQEYSDKTTNQILIARVATNDGTAEETLTLATLGKALGSGGVASGKRAVIADASGKPVIGVYDNNGTPTYFEPTNPSKTIPESDPKVKALNVNGPNSLLQTGLNNGSLRLMVQNDEDNANTNTDTYYGNDKTTGYVRKSVDSLDGVRSRYYTEDDAAAQAEYTSAMARVNALDTRLENKLNQIETQKKAVEQEMESVKSLKDKNIERTFKYFG